MSYFSATIEQISNKTLQYIVLGLFGISLLLFLVFNVLSPAPSAAAESVSFGYIYNEATGGLLTGATVSMTGPGVVTVNDNGSATGIYDFITDGTTGVYTLSVTPPSGYQLSQTCLEQKEIFRPTGTATNTIGSGQVASTLTDSTCAGNPYYFSFYLENGNPTTTHNNIPMVADPAFLSSNEYAMAPEYGSFFGLNDGGNYIFIQDSVYLADGSIVFIAGGTEALAGSYPTFTNHGTGDAANGDVLVGKISPTGSLQWGTIVGGSNGDWGQDIAEDSFGNIVVVGFTDNSTDFPTTAGSYDPTYNGDARDGFIFALSADGSTLITSTYFGGDFQDVINAVDIAADGSILVAGMTQSTNIADNTIATGTISTIYGVPLVTAGTADDGDGFVMRMDADMQNIQYFRYINTNGTATGVTGEACLSVNELSNGDIYAGCILSATGATTTAGAYDITFAGPSNDAYFIRFTGNGSTINYATYFGDNGQETPLLDDVRELADGTIVTGLQEVDVAGLATTGAYDTTFNGGTYDAMLLMLTSTLTPQYATYIGGSSDDTLYGVGIDNSGAIVMAMRSDSADAPVGTYPYQPSHSGNTDLYTAIFSTTGTYIGGGFLGGSASEGPNRATVSPSGTILYTGAAGGNGLPTSTNAYQGAHSGDGTVDGFLTSILFLPVASSSVSINTSTIGTVSEAGATTSYTIVLDEAPTTTVTITVLPDEDLGVSTTSINFDALNWDTPVVVTVTATDDNLVEGTHFGQITHTISSAGIYGDAIVPAIRTIAITDNDTAGYTVGTTTIPSYIDEDQTIVATFTIQLAAAPTSTVFFDVTSDSESTLSTTSIFFTSSTWNVPQIVTTTAFDDGIQDGTHSTVVTIAPSTTLGTPTNFHTLASTTLTITVIDNDTPYSIGTSTVATVEGGATGTLTLVLNALATSTVTLNLTASSSQVTLSTTTVVFTTATWAVSQNITVTAVDDFDIEGSHLDYILIAVAAGSAGEYAALATTTVTTTIADNDVAAGITVTETSGSTIVTEGGATDTFTVVLTTPPSTSVIVGLSTTTNQASISTTSIFFATSTWNTPITVTVTAVDDTDVESLHTETANIFVSSSADARFTALTTTTLTISIIDNDSITSDSSSGSGGGISALFTSGFTSVLTTVLGTDDPETEEETLEEAPQTQSPRTTELYTTSPTITSLSSALNLRSDSNVTIGVDQCASFDLEFFIDTPDGERKYEWTNVGQRVFGRRIYIERTPPYYERYIVEFEDQSIAHSTADFDFDDVVIEVEEYFDTFAVVMRSKNATWDHHLGVRISFRGELVEERTIYAQTSVTKAAELETPGSSLMVQTVTGIQSSCTVNEHSCDLSCADLTPRIMLGLGDNLYQSDNSAHAIIDVVENTNPCKQSKVVMFDTTGNGSYDNLWLRLEQRDGLVHVTPLHANVNGDAFITVNMRYNSDTVHNYTLYKGDLQTIVAARQTKIASLELDQTTQCLTEDWFQ